MNDFLLDLIALLSCDSRAEWVVGQVTADSNSSRLDHGCIVSFKWRALKLSVVHVTDVLGTLGMAVVLLDDLVHHWSESSV